MIAVALEGLETLLKMGEESATKGEDSSYVMEIERCGGIDSIESLQQHSNEYIYEQAFNILEKYFQNDEDQLGLGELGGMSENNQFTL